MPASPHVGADGLYDHIGTDPQQMLLASVLPGTSCERIHPLAGLDDLGPEEPMTPSPIACALGAAATGAAEAHRQLGARPGNEIPQGVGCRCLKRSGAPPRFTVLSPERA